MDLGTQQRRRGRGAAGQRHRRISRQQRPGLLRRSAARGAGAPHQRASEPSRHDVDSALPDAHVPHAAGGVARRARASARTTTRCSPSSWATTPTGSPISPRPRCSPDRPHLSFASLSDSDASSASISDSPSDSASVSPSGSVSPSLSPSASPSDSPSDSASASSSPSVSGSAATVGRWRLIARAVARDDVDDPVRPWRRRQQARARR